MYMSDEEAIGLLSEHTDFSEEQKGWKVFVTIVSIAGSIASIVSFFVNK